MAEFKSYRGYQQFASSITTQWRFARNAEQTEFLDACKHPHDPTDKIAAITNAIMNAEIELEDGTEIDADPPTIRKKTDSKIQLGLTPQHSVNRRVSPSAFLGKV